MERWPILRSAIFFGEKELENGGRGWSKRPTRNNGVWATRGFHLTGRAKARPLHMAYGRLGLSRALMMPKVVMMPTVPTAT